MLRFFVNILATALSLLVVDILLPGVNIATFPAALIAAIAVGLVNSSVKPALTALSLPLNYLSLGLFSLVVNGFCLWLASLFVPGFIVKDLVSAIIGAVILSFVNTLLNQYFAEKNPKLAGTQPNIEVNS